MNSKDHLEQIELKRHTIKVDQLLFVIKPKVSCNPNQLKIACMHITNCWYNATCIRFDEYCSTFWIYTLRQLAAGQVLPSCAIRLKAN
jgi:hypothetical protein